MSLRDFCELTPMGRSSGGLDMLFLHVANLPRTREALIFQSGITVRRAVLLVAMFVTAALHVQGTGFSLGWGACP